MRPESRGGKLRSGGAALVVTVLAIIVLAGCKSRPEDFLNRGRKLVEKKEYSRALLEFRNAARLQPKNAEPYYQAGLAYLGMGDYKQAYANLNRATELDPRNVRAQQKLVEVIGTSIRPTWDSANLEEAQKRLQSALAMVPDSPEAMSALGLSEYLLGKPDDAVKHLETALGRFPKNLQAARSLAMIKMHQKDLPGAELILRKLAADSPQSVEAQLALGRFYAMTHRPNDAESAYRKVLSIDPRFGPALQDLARLQLGAGRKDDAEKTLLALSALSDKQYRPLHAIYLFEQGRQDEAVKEFERQAASDQKDREAFTRLTSAYFFAKRYPDAERAVNAALKRNPGDIEALLQRSRLYLMTAKLQEAESDLNRVFHSEPNSATAHYLLSKVFLARGQQLGQRQQLGETLRLDPAMLGARLELAGLLTVSGAAQSALELMDQTPHAQMISLPVIVERNWVFYALNDDAEMRKGIDRGLAIARSPELLLQDGLLKIRRKDVTAGRNSLEAVLVASPENVDALAALARTYRDEKQPAVALQVVRQYAARQPRSARLQSVLGDWLVANKEFEEARKAYTAALTSDPSLVNLRIFIAELDVSEGKLEPARRALESIAQVRGLAPKAEIALAALEEKAGNENAAIVHYRKILELDPNNVPVLNNLAYRLADSANQRDQDEALKYAQQAKELDSHSIVVEDTIGWAFYRKGLYESAVTHLEACVAKEPKALYKYHLAMAYLKSGNRPRGRKLFDEARNMDPNMPEMTMAQKLIDAPASSPN